MKFSTGILNQVKRGDQHLITVEIVPEVKKAINTINGSRGSTAEQPRSVIPRIQSSLTGNTKSIHKNNFATHTDVDDQAYNDNYNYETFDERKPISRFDQSIISDMPADVQLPV